MSHPPLHRTAELDQYLARDRLVRLPFPECATDGGMYVPSLVEQIHTHGSVNLKGFAVGNGIIGHADTFPGANGIHYEMLHNHGPFISTANECPPEIVNPWCDSAACRLPVGAAVGRDRQSMRRGLCAARKPDVHRRVPGPAHAGQRDGRQVLCLRRVPTPSNISLDPVTFPIDRLF